ncbi:hypothetical protein BC828DRAFT_401934 [Blastocladiella britannica]|nr:hypothetical protein BC828DRAFT_401934 [Blastocladiella britannica]
MISPWSLPPLPPLRRLAPAAAATALAWYHYVPRNGGLAPVAQRRPHMTSIGRVVDANEEVVAEHPTRPPPLAPRARIDPPPILAPPPLRTVAGTGPHHNDVVDNSTQADVIHRALALSQQLARDPAGASMQDLRALAAYARYARRYGLAGADQLSIRAAAIVAIAASASPLASATRLGPIALALDPTLAFDGSAVATAVAPAVHALALAVAAGPATTTSMPLDDLRALTRVAASSPRSLTAAALDTSIVAALLTRIATAGRIPGPVAQRVTAALVAALPEPTQQVAADNAPAAVSTIARAAAAPTWWPTASPAATSAFLARVPIAAWPDRAWVAVAACEWVDPFVVARVYLGEGAPSITITPTTTFAAWQANPAFNDLHSIPESGAAFMHVNPLVMAGRDLKVITVLLQRLLRARAPHHMWTDSHRAEVLRLADDLVDAARGLDWNMSFLNAVLEAYLAAGQVIKARYLLNELMTVPDVYTLRVMLKYAPTPQDIPNVIKEWARRAPHVAALENSKWTIYWLVRRCLETDDASLSSALDSSDADADNSAIGTDETRQEEEDDLALLTNIEADGDEDPSWSEQQQQPPPLRPPWNPGTWDVAQRLIDSTLTHAPRAVAPATCNLLLRQYARHGQVTRAERLVTTMRRHFKWTGHSSGLLMMCYAQHHARWLGAHVLGPDAGWARETMRARGFEDIWRVWQAHLNDVQRARTRSAVDPEECVPNVAAIGWLLSAGIHPLGRHEVMRTVASLTSLGVELDLLHAREMWRLVAKMYLRGKLGGSVETGPTAEAATVTGEVFAALRTDVRGRWSQVRCQEHADWDAWAVDFAVRRGIPVLDPLPSPSPPFLPLMHAKLKAIEL